MNIKAVVSDGPEGKHVIVSDWLILACLIKFLGCMHVIQRYHVTEHRQVTRQLERLFVYVDSCSPCFHAILFSRNKRKMFFFYPVIEKERQTKCNKKRFCLHKST